MKLTSLVKALLDGRGFMHKRDISDAMSNLMQSCPAPTEILVGDDCAVIPNGDEHLLFAIEGFVNDFVTTMPWFAGFCGVMVNISDIYAMGGRPIAVVDAIWSSGAGPSKLILEGMAHASSIYNVPVIGGHTNHRSETNQLAVAVLGRAKKLLTSFDAKPGQQLVMAIDLRGRYMTGHPYWNATTDAPAYRLRGDLELLPELAELGLCAAAKDISMAGAIGTALMLLECSKVGAQIDIDAIPRPIGVDALKWLQSFPSYGFVLSVDETNVDLVIRKFHARGLACAVVGQVSESTELWLSQGSERDLLWDHSKAPFILGNSNMKEVANA